VLFINRDLPCINPCDTSGKSYSRRIAQARGQPVECVAKVAPGSSALSQLC